MPSREAQPLLGTSNFRVRIGRREVGFCEVGRLSSATEQDADGTRYHGFDAIVLRRALTRSQELYEWRRRIAEGRDDRRDVTISQLAAPAGQVVNAWRLVRAWPRRWSGPAFDAGATGLAYEELELAFDDLVWLSDNRAQGA